MKARTVQTVVFFAFLLALLVPALKIAFAPAPPQYFNVTVQLTNVAPFIHNISINGDATPPFSAVPLEDTWRNVSIVFNVSDANGQADISDASIVATLNFSGTVKRNASGCTTITTGTNDKQYNCTLRFDFFDENSSLYSLNVTAADAAGTRGENNTIAAFTYDILTAITPSISGAGSSLTFASSPGSTNVRPNADQNIRNTGNDAFRRVNFTGFDLNGITEVLGATNFTINWTNSTNAGGNLIGEILGNGTSLVGSGQINFTNTSDSPILPRGNRSNVTLYFSVNISAALTEKTFNASRLWNITVNRDKP